MLLPIRNKIPDNGDKLPNWEASKTFFYQLYLVIKRAEWRIFYAAKDFLDITSPTKNWRAVKDGTSSVRKFVTVGMSEGSEQSTSKVSLVMFTSWQPAQEFCIFFSTIKKLLKRAIWSWKPWLYHSHIYCIWINRWYCVSSFNLKHELTTCLQFAGKLMTQKIALGLNVVDETIPQSLTPENCSCCQHDRKSFYRKENFRKLHEYFT